MVWLAVVALIAILSIRVDIALPRAGNRPILDAPVLALIIPLIAALIIGSVTAEPFGKLEQTTSRPLPHLRAIFLAILLGWSALTLLVVTSWSSSLAAEIIIVRNLLGLTGMACFGAWLVGSELSWLFPFTYVFLSGLLGPTMKDGMGAWSWWVWLLQPATDHLALALAGLCALGGMALYCRYGPRALAETG